MNMFKRFAKLSGLVIVPMFGLVSPLLVIPAMTSRFGADAWVAVALGQSIGGAASVVVELGWGLNGPQRVARQGRAFSQQTLAVSIITKLVVLVPLGALAFFIALQLAPAFSLESGLVAVGASTLGLSCSWFFIGTRRVGRLLLADAVPRLVCAVISALVILSGGALWTFALIGMLIPSALTVFLALLVNRVSFSQLRTYSVRRVFRLIRLQGAALSGRALSAIYIALPVTIVTLAAPAAVPVFAAAERLQRMYLQLLGAFPNMMQGWVGSPGDGGIRMARIRSALLYNALLGLVAGVMFTFAAPIAATYVFSGVAAIPFEVSCIGGILVLLVCTSRATGGLALVSLRRVDVIAWSALSGVVVGVPAIFVFATWLGPLGGLIGEVLAELFVLGVQLAGLASAKRRARAREATVLTSA